MIQWILASLVCIAPLKAEITILAISGSTREGSYNKKLVAEAARIAREKGAIVNVVDLKDYPMPLYDEDLEAASGMPTQAKRLRQLMIESDAVIISSPEYNHSIPGVLKNALDWCSKDEEGKFSYEPFDGKKFAIMSASPGKKGGAKGLAHLRDIIADLRGTVLEAQVSVGKANAAFDSKGRLVDSDLTTRLDHEISYLFSGE